MNIKTKITLPATIRQRWLSRLPLSLFPFPSPVFRFPIFPSPTVSLEASRAPLNQLRGLGSAAYYIHHRNKFLLFLYVSVNIVPYTRAIKRQFLFFLGLCSKQVYHHHHVRVLKVDILRSQT